MRSSTIRAWPIVLPAQNAVVLYVVMLSRTVVNWVIGSFYYSLRICRAKLCKPSQLNSR